MSRRVELGLDGGGVLIVTLDAAAVSALTGTYTGGGGFYSVTSDEGEHVVNLEKVTYVRVLTGDAPARPGFGGGS